MTTTVTTTVAAPGRLQEPWVYDLIAAVAVYEDVHGGHTDGWPCLGHALDQVPFHELDRARVLDNHRRIPAPTRHHEGAHH